MVGVVASHMLSGSFASLYLNSHDIHIGQHSNCEEQKVASFLGALIEAKHAEESQVLLYL